MSPDLKDENDRLREALTPSDATREEYMNRFRFSFPTLAGFCTPNVPWTTIKEIMAAILKRADRPGGNNE